MERYEVLKETMNPCAGSLHPYREIYDIETRDPIQYARDDSSWSVIEITEAGQNDIVVLTGDGNGYFRKYTFNKY